MLNAVAVAGEWCGPVEFVDGGVEIAMGFAQFARHYVHIIQISQS